MAIAQRVFTSGASKAKQIEAQSDLILIKKARKGDVRAFESLFHRYHMRVLNLAYRIVGDSDGAKDVTQETFIRLYRSLGQFKNEKKFFSWVYRITVNLCYDHLRREKRHRGSPLEENVINSNQEPEGDNTDSELIEKIYEMTGLLSTDQKSTFILREVEGLSCKEIARILDCKVGTVRSHLFHARTKLRRMILENYPELLEGIQHEL